MLLSKSIRKHFRKSAYLAKRLPVFALEQDKVIFRDGRVAVGFRVHGAPLESWSEGHFQQANERLTRQLKLLPVGTVVQKTDVYFDHAFRPDYPPGDGTTERYYESKLLEHFFDRLVLRHGATCSCSSLPNLLIVSNGLILSPAAFLRQDRW